MVKLPQTILSRQCVKKFELLAVLLQLQAPSYLLWSVYTIERCTGMDDKQTNRSAEAGCESQKSKYEKGKHDTIHTSMHTTQ